jgi:hypothetical protein
MADNIQIYCNCMERVRRHVHIADQVFVGKIDTHDRDLSYPTERVESGSHSRQRFSCLASENQRTMNHCLGTPNRRRQDLTAQHNQLSYISPLGTVTPKNKLVSRVDSPSPFGDWLFELYLPHMRHDRRLGTLFTEPSILYSGPN